MMLIIVRGIRNSSLMLLNKPGNVLAYGPCSFVSHTSISVERALDHRTFSRRMTTWPASIPATNGKTSSGTFTVIVLHTMTVMCL